jgi:hypothetical protein
MHFPATPLSQKNETGVHWKMEIAVKVKTHTKMRQRARYTVQRRVLLEVANKRLKKRSNEALIQARAHRWIKLFVKRIYHARLDCVTIRMLYHVLTLKMPSSCDEDTWSSYAPRPSCAPVHCYYSIPSFGYALRPTMDEESVHDQSHATTHP